MKKHATLLDKDLQGSHAALKRAARAALITARKTGTPCYVVKDGKIVDIAAVRPHSSKRSAR